MGLRPTTKKVNGRWYDINQAADRIAELEQQLAEKQKAYDELDMMFIAMRDVKRGFEQQVKALTKAAEKQILLACTNAVEKLNELAPEQGWDSGETVAEMHIRGFRKATAQQEE